MLTLVISAVVPYPRHCVKFIAWLKTTGTRNPKIISKLLPPKFSKIPPPSKNLLINDLVFKYMSKIFETFVEIISENT